MSGLNGLQTTGALPASALSTFAPPTPQELARWHYEQAQFWLDVVHDMTGLEPEFRPQLCVTYRFPASSDEGARS